MWKRCIIHVDMDAFFAAVEQERHPEYKGKPVIVGGSGNPFTRGVASTCSYEARRYGIRSAMPLREAYRRCPFAIFLPVDYEEYERISLVIMDILKEFSPLLEQVGLDEAFIDISGDISEVKDGMPEEIAKEIKRKIKGKANLTASVGIGPNKLLAKIASDMNKPDGLTIITEENAAEVLAPLPTLKIWGVGPKTEARLKEMGINTIGELAKASLEALENEFGKVWGMTLKEHALGIDESPVVTDWEPKSASAETTYQRDTRDLIFIKKTLYSLTEDVASRLKREGYKGRTITVKIRYSNFTTFTKTKTIKEATNDLEILYKTAEELLGKFTFDKLVRLVGVRAGNFVKEEKKILQILSVDNQKPNK